MTKPLALIFYQKVMPGSQLVNRLQDLKYRVQVLNELADLPRRAQSDGPMLVFVDLESGGEEACRTIRAMKANAATQHIPIIAFAKDRATALHSAAQKAGATLTAGDAGLLAHLEELMDRALQVE